MAQAKINLPLDDKNKIQQELTRIVIVNQDKCKPKKCRQECKRSCPVVRIGKLCIDVGPDSAVAVIAEPLCIGCNICVQKCPFEALSIVNLPTNLNKDTTHRFGPNAFKLHRLPIPRLGEVLGLVGKNGIGKSTALKILSGKLKPNLGNFEHSPDWTDILANFRGSTLQNYFTKVLEDNLKSVMKPQYIDQLPKFVKGTVRENLLKSDETNSFDKMVEKYDLANILENQIDKLSGGELQRFACAAASLKKCDIYIFDEPSSYLDVKQRLKAASAIRELIDHDRYIIAVEHDLSVLDFLSDHVCLLYGSPGHYGVVSYPSVVVNGINHFLDGYLPSENIRFRETELTFRIAEADENEILRTRNYEYPDMTKTQGQFKLSIKAGSFTDSEIVILFGENGTGKTTLIRLLAGQLKPDGDAEVPALNISYKPQTISPKFPGTVAQLLMTRIRDAMVHAQFKSDVLKPLDIESLMDREVTQLSGGEIQRVAITICLGKPADVYLIDEPSAYLDAEQRINTARVIKRFIRNAKKTAFIVEHDFLMATYMADRVIVFEGTPAVSAECTAPQSLLTGINIFLKSLGITFRRDRNNFRPRINKPNGAKDIEQKKSGHYFFLEEY